MEMKYPHLFSPLKIGNLTLRNRIICSPISLPELTAECFPTTEDIAFYEMRARGGAAVVTLGDCIVESATGQSHEKQTHIDDPMVVPSLTTNSRNIKRHGALAAIELSHGGKFAGIPNLENPNAKSEAFGPMDEIVNGYPVKQMPEEVILHLVQAYKTAAARARFAGYDIVVLHAGHGWLLSQFMSPTNQRKDQYGGSLENRLRFPILVAKAVREAIGPRMAIDFRMNFDELYEGGMHLDEAIRVAEIMQDYVDSLHISAGNQHVPNCFVRTHPSMFLPAGVNVEAAAEIRKHVRIPVIVVGGINDPAMAEEIIASGKADAVAMARTLIADPFWPQKAREGRDGDLVRCMHCFACMGSIIGLRDVVCALNPLAGRETEYEASRYPAPRSKRVLVAGGGPGGMYAAMTAARRGHTVTLCEASGALGGQILCEAHVDFKKDYYAFAQCLIRQVTEDPRITVRLNTPVTPELAEELKPDCLICAIGAAPIIPGIDGIDGPNVVFPTELRKEKPGIGQRVVIIGAGLVGCESAVHFRREGKQVTVVELRDDFAPDANAWHKMALGMELEDRICLRLGMAARRITPEGVVCINADGDEEFFPADTVFCAVGMRAPYSQVDALRNSAPEFRSIGDCNGPGKVQTAVAEGYYAAMDL